MPALSTVTQGKNALENAAIAGIGGLPNDPDFRPEHAVDWALACLIGQAVSIRAFGAKGDGRNDDTAAIQLAINSGAARGIPVIIPSAEPGGAFLLSGPRQPAYRPVSALVTDALLVVPSGLKLYGTGYNSVLKVADNYSAGGDYRIFGAGAIVTNDVELANFRIDCNGSNNLVIDSGANIRRAYPINLLTGDRCSVHDMWIHNTPSRNVILLNNNGGVGQYDFTNTKVYNCRIWDVGGAIVGNENQNDHSSVSINGDRCQVYDNQFWNTVQPDGLGVPSRVVTAIETHFKNGIVARNSVHNFTVGVNTGGNTHDNPNVKIVDNTFTGMTGNIISVWTNFAADRYLIARNHIEIDNAVFAGAIGINQSTNNTVTVQPWRDLTIEDNYIYATLYGATANNFYGMQLVALENFTIRNNIIRNTQGYGILLTAAAVNVLSIRNGTISNNTFIDCGIQTGSARPFALFITNSSVDNREIANITGKNNRVVRTFAATVLGSRGFRISGVAAGAGGYINNVYLDVPDCEGIIRSQRADLASTTNFRDVGYLPRIVPHARATDPTEGFWHNGQDYVVHTDPVSAGFFGKIPSASGSAVSGVWAISTAYTLGQWIRTSTIKVLKCRQAGVSDGAVEPTPGTLGQQVADGTVLWEYVDTAVAAFKTFGLIS